MRHAVLALAALSLAACETPTGTALSAPVAEAKPVRTVQSTDVDQVLSDPCSAEPVHLTGTAYVFFQNHDKGGGEATQKAHLNYQGVGGVGLTSGRKYRLVAAANQSGQFEGTTEAFVIRQHVALISQGSSDNFQIFQVAEFGFDGTDSYFNITRERMECVG